MNHVRTRNDALFNHQLCLLPETVATDGSVTAQTVVENDSSVEIADVTVELEVRNGFTSRTLIVGEEIDPPEPVRGAAVDRLAKPIIHSMLGAAWLSRHLMCRQHPAIAGIRRGFGA